MIRKLTITTILVALAATPAFAQKQRLTSLDANGNLDALIARHAAANNVPEDLVRRVIKRESGGNPRVVSAGNYGLMQIKLATAHYLAGAYRVANGNTNRAVHYYAAGYYYAAKGKSVPMKSADNSLAAYASAAPGSVKFSYERSLRRAISHSESVASSPSLYSGRPDYY